MLRKQDSKHIRRRREQRVRHVTNTAKRHAFNCIVASALGTEETELERLMDAAQLVIRQRHQMRKLPLRLTMAINELQQALKTMEAAK